MSDACLVAGGVVYTCCARRGAAQEEEDELAAAAAAAAVARPVEEDDLHSTQEEFDQLLRQGFTPDQAAEHLSYTTSEYWEDDGTPTQGDLIKPN